LFRSLVLVVAFFFLLPAQAAEQGSVEHHDTVSSTTRRPRIGLALGGGGTRGVAHIGVLRVLQQHNIPIDYIAGTSMGAIVGGFYCAGVPLDRIQALLEDKQLMHAYYTVPLPLRIAVIPVFLVPRAFGYSPYDGLYRGNKFAHFIDKQLPSDRKNIEELHIPFAAVCSDLLSGKAYAVKSGNLGRAIQASCAVPVLRRPVSLQDKLLVDGGIEANLPVAQVKEMGADFVIAIDVDENFEEQPHNFRKILSVGNRVTSMLLAKIDEEAVRNADIVIAPDVNRIRLLSNKSSDGLKASEAGRVAAEQAIPEIERRLASIGVKLDAVQSASSPSLLDR
jgi:NTE family protein